MAQNITGSKINVNDLRNAMQQFGVYDYIVFILMLTVCALVGIYFAFQDNRKKMKEKRRGSVELDYLVGGRKMRVFPVVLSLIASWVSGISLIGSSAEIYVYGCDYMFIYLAMLIAGSCVHFFFLPVFVELKMTSVYEYLQARFDIRVRTLGSVMYVMANVLSMPIVIYVPALAFNQVTGINIHIITPVTCLICIFYTTLGGMKAVVWTDFIQTIIMFGTMLLIVIKGTGDAGGLSFVLEKNIETGRIQPPSFSLDPTVRHTFFSIVIGGAFFMTQANSTTQGMQQRYLSLPDLKSARRALWSFIFGVSFLLGLCYYNGFLIFALYHDCDPITTTLAKEKDQLVPLLVMEVFKNTPGLPGFYVAGIFSAALSSLSTGLNALSAVVLTDFVKPFIKKPLTDSQTNYIMRGAVIGFGVLSVALVIVIQHLGAVHQLSISLGGVTGGPLFAIFIMGLMMPWINARSAFFGGVSGIIIMSWIAFNTQTAIHGGEIYFLQKPVRTDGCDYEFELNENRTNEFLMSNQTQAHGSSLYHISYMWITMLGTITSIIMALISMIVYGKQDYRNLDSNILAPFIRKYINVSKETDDSFKKKVEVTHKFDKINIVDYCK